jgi:hypothetical protein
MSETDTDPYSEMRVLGESNTGMLKAMLVFGDGWIIRYFPSRAALEALATEYNMPIKEVDDDTGDNRA